MSASVGHGNQMNEVLCLARGAALHKAGVFRNLREFGRRCRRSGMFPAATSRARRSPGMARARRPGLTHTTRPSIQTQGLLTRFPCTLDARQHTQPASRTLKLGPGPGFFHASHETRFFSCSSPRYDGRLKRINVIYGRQQERRYSCYMLHHVSDMEGLLLQSEV